MGSKLALADMGRRRIAGVTLLELMAVVMVIGILGIIAIPSYRNYVTRAQRTDAKTALLRLATNQERFYLQNRTYSSDPSALGFPDNRSDKGAYTLTIEDADAQGYRAIATPRSGGAFDMTGDEECEEFSITAQGTKEAEPDDFQRCW